MVYYGGRLYICKKIEKILWDARLNIEKPEN